MRVDVDGGAVDADVVGAGPRVVLLRGLARDRRYWGDFPQRLGERAEVMTLDTPGFGGSTPLPGRPRMADYAARVAAALRTAGWTRTAVFGISWGGALAQQLALDLPELVSHLILGCTTPGGATAVRPARRVIAMLAASIVAPRPLAARLSARLTVSRGHRARLAREHAELMRLAPARAEVRKQLAALRAFDATPRLSSLDVPTLVVTGTADVLIPPANSDQLARLIPHARLVRLPDLGHDFIAEEPARVVELVASFLEP
ncbi:MAG: alpha/beta fold hydrolase [Acidobacteriota bacterium]